MYLVLYTHIEALAALAMTLTVSNTLLSQNSDAGYRNLKKKKKSEECAWNTTYRGVAEHQFKATRF